jgi:hypothetical protein
MHTGCCAATITIAAAAEKSGCVDFFSGKVMNMCLEAEAWLDNNKRSSFDVGRSTHWTVTITLANILLSLCA